MKRIDRSVPKALRDVWQWKDAIYREVKDLPVDKALSAILDRAEQAAPNARAAQARGRGKASSAK